MNRLRAEWYLNPLKVPKPKSKATTLICANICWTMMNVTNHQRLSIYGKRRKILFGDQPAIEASLQDALAIVTDETVQNSTGEFNSHQEKRIRRRNFLAKRPQYYSAGN